MSDAGKKVFKKVDIFFKSDRKDWRTPKILYEQLDKKFHFDDDPCPVGGSGGLDREWGKSVYVNPPYGRDIRNWILKAVREVYPINEHDDIQWMSRSGKRVVMLLPSNTDTKWFHELVLPYSSKIFFIKGRLHFDEHKDPAPFASMVVVFG